MAVAPTRALTPPASTNGKPPPMASASVLAAPVSQQAMPRDTATPTQRSASPAGPDARPATARAASTPNDLAPWLADPLLAFAADTLDDIERVRIAGENRLRQVTRVEPDSDGEKRGFGLLGQPEVVPWVVYVLAMKCDSEVAANERTGRRPRCCLEHEAERTLAKLLRKHPLRPWMKEQRGVGAKQGARLLAAIGDPYWNTLHGRPRTVSELWAYCGYRPGQRRRKGVRDNWSATAKMRAFKVAESCLKQLAKPCHSIKDDGGEYVGAEHVDGCACSPYRVIYDRGRAKYVGTVHPEDCARCGPSGHPAPTGSPRSAKHQHQMAIRLMTKTFLRDLWREAKRLHDGHPPA